MGKLGIRLACVSAAALLSGLGFAGQANAADSFGLDAQSAYFNSVVNAGAAAGGDISSMYWNPAATATLTGVNSSSNITGAFIGVKERATGGALAAAPFSHTTDVGVDSLPLSSFSTYQVSDRFYLGLAIAAPYGLTTKPDNFWVGSPLATTSRIFTADFTPTAAYKLTPTVTVGVGLQVMYLEARLDNAGLAPSLPNKVSKEDGWGVGATAGIMWQPSEVTSLGLGYRSRVDVDYNGSLASTGFLAAPPAGLPYSQAINGTVPLPDQITFSARQAVSPRLTLLGTVEWQNWSGLGNVVSSSSTLPAPYTSLLGLVGGTVHFNYQDSWALSGGLEYAYSPTLTLRAGVGYDWSPITASVRDITVPDTNDVKIGIGASYRYSDRITIDLAYNHEFFEDGSFCIANPATNGGTLHCTGAPTELVLLKGSASPTVDAVSVGLHYKWSGAAPLESYK